MKFKSKIYLDYDDVLSMCHNLEYEVSKFKPDFIVGITRGGLQPALHLSHALERPLITINWQTRDVDNREIDTFLLQQIDQQKNVVFVDDINDTGKTFTGIDQAYHCSRPNVMMISLVAKTESCYKAKAALTIDDERWIVFPWEKV